MKIIDEETNQEITEWDESAGCLIESQWASPEAYATVDFINKKCLAEDDYETVLLYHKYQDWEKDLLENGPKEKRGYEEIVEKLEALSNQTEKLANLMDRLTSRLKL